MDDIREQAFRLFQQHAHEVGFLVREQLDKYALYTVDRDGNVIGAALAEHDFGDVTIVHAIAVDETARGQGVAQSLVNEIVHDSPHTLLEAKCDVGLPANKFSQQTGWENVRQTGDGRMNVWHYAC